MEAETEESVDKHMVKYRGKSNMRMKNKPIKWGFKMCYRCDPKTGYLYQFDICTDRKDNKVWLR